MKEYILQVKAYKEEPDLDYGYPTARKKIVHVTEAEIFEAVSKYLQVKGFSTEMLSLQAAEVKLAKPKYKGAK